MGMSAHGQLFYGVDFADGGPFIEDDWDAEWWEEWESDGEEYINQKILHMVYPDGLPDYPDRKDFENPEDYEKAWRSNLEVRREMESKIPVNFTSYGYDYTGHSLVINGANHGVSWGPVALGKKLFDSDPETWDAILKEWCEKLGLKYTDPQWYFGAYYS